MVFNGQLSGSKILLNSKIAIESFNNSFFDQYIELYPKIWSTCPYFEVFKEEEIISTICKQQLSYVLTKEDKLIGFISGYSLIRHHSYNYLPKELSNKNGFYFSEFAIHENYREGKIAYKLFKYFEDNVAKLGYDFLILRTSSNESENPAINFYNQNNFIYLKDSEGNTVSDEVEQMRTNGLVETDTRNYFIKINIKKT